jgi:hypothetical protein
LRDVLLKCVQRREFLQRDYESDLRTVPRDPVTTSRITTYSIDPDKIIDFIDEIATDRLTTAIFPQCFSAGRRQRNDASLTGCARGA